MDHMDVQSSGVKFEFTFCNVCGHFGRHYSHFEVVFCIPCQDASCCQTAGSLLRAACFEIQPTWASNTECLQSLKNAKTAKKRPCQAGMSHFMCAERCFSVGTQTFKLIMIFFAECLILMGYFS